ncbi:hypothetical protein [Sinorhizobium meliloti]|nr:hypothetical protein [Sinorhizobium meliloti]
MSSDRLPSILELVKAALWPAIALIALLMFFSPLSQIIMSVSRRADQIETLKLGSLELNIQVSQLPRADKETAEAISGMDNEMVRNLLFAPDGSSLFGHCYKPEIDLSQNEHAAIERLASKKLVTWTKSNDPGECAEHYSVEITALGTKARRFLFDLISSQVSSSIAQ